MQFSQYSNTISQSSAMELDLISTPVITDAGNTPTSEGAGDGKQNAYHVRQGKESAIFALPAESRLISRKRCGAPGGPGTAARVAPE